MFAAIAACCARVSRHYAGCAICWMTRSCTLAYKLPKEVSERWKVHGGQMIVFPQLGDSDWGFAMTSGENFPCISDSRTISDQLHSNVGCLASESTLQTRIGKSVQFGSG